MYSTHLHDMVDAGQELGVDAQATVQGVPRLGVQSLRKLALEHKHRTSTWACVLYMYTYKRTSYICSTQLHYNAHHTHKHEIAAHAHVC